jgi:hypothetical protein
MDPEIYPDYKYITFKRDDIHKFVKDYVLASTSGRDSEKAIGMAHAMREHELHGVVVLRPSDTFSLVALHAYLGAVHTMYELCETMGVEPPLGFDQLREYIEARVTEVEAAPRRFPTP